MQVFKFTHIKGQYRLFLFVIIFLLLSLASHGTIYYIDCDQGLDNNGGLSPTDAWKTLGMIEKTTFQPGDAILLKRDCVWNESLVFSHSGTVSSPIRIDAYGSGKQPLIMNYNTIDSWVKSKKPFVYKCQVKSWCYGLYEDGKKLKEASSPALSDGNWYFDSGNRIIYYKPTDGDITHHTCTYANRWCSLCVDGADYIVIKNIEFKYGASGIVLRNGSDHVTVSNCIFSYLYEQAIQLYNTDGYCIITGNIITKCGDGIYLMGKPGDNHIITHNLIKYCNYEEYNNNDGHAIGIQNSSNNLVSHNEISYCINSIAIWAAEKEQSNNNTISYNNIYSCKKKYKKPYQGIGIVIGSAKSSGTSNNKIYYNKIKECNFGIKFSVTNGKNMAANNLIYCCRKGIIISRGANNCRIINNIIFESNEEHIYDEHSRNGTDNHFDYNCYYPDGKNRFCYLSVPQKSFSNWVGISGEDRHSKIENPKLFSQGGKFIGLFKGSVCIDSGTNVGIAKDFYGVSVPQGKRVDIGPFEYINMQHSKQSRDSEDKSKVNAHNP